jgi:hypothetical protein
MANIAADYAAILKTLINDNELKELMLIPFSEQSNFAKLRSTYFVESYTSDVMTTEQLCRLVIHPAPQGSTGNPMIRDDSVIIEIFVPVQQDAMEGFERRVLKIAGRIIKLLHRQRMNDRLLWLTGQNELFSSIEGFRRYYVRFNYKRAYS